MAIHPTHDEEQALVRAFFGGDNAGYFVEVGANHPTEGSQTWHLEQAGWTGVLVEPQPDLAAFLVTSRKARVFATACSSPDIVVPGSFSWHVLSSLTDDVSTFHDGHGPEDSHIFGISMTTRRASSLR